MKTIVPTRALPAIGEAVVIDGYTQPRAAPATPSSPAAILIELNGNNVIGEGLRLVTTPDSANRGSTVRGLAINRFQQDGIDVEASGSATPPIGAHTISGCYIGIDPGGAAGAANGGDGIYITFTDGNIIGGVTPAARNVISANAGMEFCCSSPATTLSSATTSAPMLPGRRRGQTGRAVCASPPAPAIESVGRPLAPATWSRAMSASGSTRRTTSLAAGTPPWRERSIVSLVATPMRRRTITAVKLLGVLLLLDLLALNLEASDRPDAKKASLTSIPGITEAIEAKLNAAGINNVNDLLAEGGSRLGREEIAARSGLAAAQILKFVHCADVFRIKGVAGRTAALLERAGVTTVAELAQRNASNLHAKLQQINDAKRPTAKMPSEQQLADWIEEAKTLPKMVAD